MTATMNISLPSELRDFVRQRVAEDKCANASDYVRASLREDRKRASAEKLEQRLLASLASGPAIPFDAAALDSIRRDATALRRGQ